MSLNVLTKANFSIIIEKIVKAKQISYIDAIVYYCEKNEMEIESAAKLVTPTIKSKLKVEAQELHFLPQTSKLPL